MRRRRKTSTARKSTHPFRGRIFVAMRNVRWMVRAGIALTAMVVSVGGAHGLSRLEHHVNELLLQRVDQARLTFVDLPASLTELARSDLHASVEDLLDHPWTEESLCRQMATRLTTVGWVARVHYVRRTADARFEISARYRLPVAMVQHEGDFVLVDAEGVRLPGLYRYEVTWPLIQGVAEAVPQPGVQWSGADLQAGLSLLAALAGEPYRGQVTAVVVENFGGRLNARRSHLELATDRPGGRIRWGSAPGREVEENSLGEKLALLRANYLQTGRADAGHPVIDISTFPDRFTIPG